MHSPTYDILPEFQSPQAAGLAGAKAEQNSQTTAFTVAVLQRVHEVGRPEPQQPIPNPIHHVVEIAAAAPSGVTQVADDTGELDIAKIRQQIAEL